MLFAPIARNATALPTDPEEYNEAASVAQHHRAVLMKIPHVKNVNAAWDAQGEVFIVVDVDVKANVDDVERQVPSQFEGFPVEVEAEVLVGSLRRERKVDQSKPPPPPARSPTVDDHGNHHHTWLKSAPSEPAQ